MDEARSLIEKLKDLRVKYNIEYKHILSEMQDVDQDKPDACAIMEVLSDKMNTVSMLRLFVNKDLESLEKFINTGDEVGLKEFLEENRHSIVMMIEKC